MAANLLLEGPDLEALLVRAHREGGTKARIVRAEKVRRGGVFGFFATEAFEVAVEIPEGQEPSGAPVAAASPAVPAAVPGAVPAASAASVTEATPIPAGLLGLAERADAKERTDAITRVPEYQYADRTLGTIPGVARPVFPEMGSWPTGQAGPAASAPVLTQDDVRVSDEPEMAAPPIRLAEEESVLPPGVRPQFTSLIDQLRDGVRDGRHREEGVRHTADHPVVAALHAGLTTEATTDGQAGTSAEHVVSALEAEAWARVTTPTASQDVQGSTSQIETDGSTMSDPAAERHETGLGQLQDEQDGLTDPTARDEPNPALPNVRASTIVPSKPGRRRGRGVPSQRHSEPVHEDDDVLGDLPISSTPADLAGEPSGAAASPWTSTGDELGTWSTDLPAAVGAHRAPHAEHESDHESEHDSEHDSDDEPRKASWWRLGRKRREDVTQEARLWTPSDEKLEPIESVTPVTSVAPVESVPEPRAEAKLKPLSPPPGFEPLIATAEVHNTYPAKDASSTPAQHTGQHRITPEPEVTEDDDLLAELGVERSTAGHVPEARSGGFTAAALQGAPAMPAASVIEDGDELAGDRQTLRDLGIPAAWTRRLQPGDRFTSVLGILDRMPELEISPESAVIAVVGSPDVVQLEAHRTALDLPADGQPRAVAVVPAGEGPAYRAALDAANDTRPVVVAVPIAPGTDPALVRATVAAVHADAVIAVVDASLSVQEMVEYFDSLERVDAVAMDGALEAEQPAAVLALDVPVVRLDGISMDRIGWAALLCAQLATRNLTAVGAEAL